MAPSHTTVGRTAAEQPTERTTGTRVAYAGEWEDVDRFPELLECIKQADSIEDYSDIFMGHDVPVPPHMKANHDNKKVGKPVARYSIGAAVDCPNRWTDNCQVDGDECYAVNTEQMYPEPLHARRRREYLWDCLDADTFARAFLHWRDRKQHDIRALRFSVSGDIRYRGDAVKIDRIGEILQDAGVDVYLYTASNYVDFREFDNFVVNASNGDVDGATREFKAVEDPSEIPDDGFRCPHDYDTDIQCGDPCMACVRPEGDHDVYVTEH